MQNEETEVWRGAPKQNFIVLHSTSSFKVVAGAGIAPAFAPSEDAVLRLDDPAGGKSKTRRQNAHSAKRRSVSAFYLHPSSFDLLPLKVVAGA